MDEMGFSSCKADPDVWMRVSVRADGSRYYQYVLLYTDDILVIMETCLGTALWILARRSIQ